MTISPLLIYVWKLADEICALKIFTFIFCAFFNTIYAIMLMSGTNIKQLKSIRILCLSSFIAWFVLFWVPDSKTIAMMYVIPKIADSKVIQTDVPELYETAKKALIEKLKN